MAFFTWFVERKMYYPRTTIFVFNSAEQFKKYNIKPDGTVIHRGGVYMPGAFGPRIALSRRSQQQSMSTVFHECAHSLVAASGMRLPEWLNEGVAEVFSTFVVSGDTTILGRHNGKSIRMLHGKRLIPMDEFFNVTKSAPYYVDRDKKGLFYAQSWLVTHYIMLGTQELAHPAENLQKYVELYKKTRKPSESDFRDAFGLDYIKLERELREYILRGQYKHYTQTLSVASISDAITCREATAQEVECELAALKMRMTDDRGEKAAARFGRLERKHGKWPRFWELYAEVSPREKRAGYVEKAVKLGSRNPLTHLWLLRDGVGRISWSPGRRLTDKEAAGMRRAAETVLEMEPDCMEAHALLATLESQCATMRDSALARANEALGRMNDDDYHRTLLALSLACWRIKDYGQAHKVCGRLLGEIGVSAVTKRRATMLRERIERDMRGR